jgi:hypothetical protein
LKKNFERQIYPNGTKTMKQVFNIRACPNEKEKSMAERIRGVRISGRNK